MCEPISEGGRRCAAHTRPAFDARLRAIRAAATPEGRNEARALAIGDVAAHASTPSGATEVARLKEHAETRCDYETVAWLTTCQRLGDAQREAANDIRRAIRDQRTQTPVTGPVARGTILHTGTGVTTDAGTSFIRRGSYVRVVHDPAPRGSVPRGQDPNLYVQVAALPFRVEDTNRAKRGPHDSPLRAVTNGAVIVIPRAALRVPAADDDSAAYFTARPHFYEGEWYTQAEVDTMMADMDEDERTDFEMDLHRGD